MNTPTKHLIDIPPAELRELILTDCHRLKRPKRSGILVAIFSRASTRTRASVAAAAEIMGIGHVELPWNSFYGNPQTHPLADSNIPAEIRSLAEIGAIALVARVDDQHLLIRMSDESPIPIISGATSIWHPLQGLTDLRVISREWLTNSKLRLVFVGNGQGPVISSLLTILTHSGIHVTVVAPEGYRPRQDVLEHTELRYYDFTTTLSGMDSADIIYTDEWFYRRLTEDEKVIFAPYRITEDLIHHYAPHARIMHCLPFASEIDPSLLYGARSLVWQQARERTETLVSVLEYLLSYDSKPD
ncbi:MAG: hypothetical protein P9F75_05570 [Candidatus Contendobacter sp.]|nr:hypothetical protein [Candidatus Contendobacter sp.]